MKKWNLVLAILTAAFVTPIAVVGLPVLVAHGDEPQPEPQELHRGITKELSGLMKRKLVNAQAVLEGIALRDFEKIAKHAEELIAVSQQAGWGVLKTPEYDLYSNDLRRNATELIQQSAAKNLDGAALAYVDLTLTCVKCHKHIREGR